MSDNILKGLRVLVVEDSATSRSLIAALLAKQNVELEFAETATLFRQKMNEKAFDLLILDNKLPDGSGIGLLREFRQTEQSTAVVIITGEAQLMTPTEVLIEGADGYLDKAFLTQGPEVFMRALERAILHRQRLHAQGELRALKDEIYDVVTHDIRSPAACASMALKMSPNRGQDEAIDTAIEALERLFHRLDRYLDFSQAESGFVNLDRQPDCLAELISEVVSNLAPLAEGKSQELLWNPPSRECCCHLDWHWMHRAVENLLENAIKYTPVGGKIRVECLAENDLWSVKVSDNGIGIPEEQQARLFQRFFRGSRTRESAGGSGLGLLIVKKVIEGHGGHVSVASSGTAGEGSVFSVFLPHY